MKLILAIAAGGALGAVGRHLVASRVMHLLGPGFPFGTLTVNILGSFAMGLLLGAMMQFWSPSPELRAFLTVGFLGAFTTFSTFSMETILLLERSDYLSAGLYVLFSVAFSLAGFFAGLWLLRAVAS